MFFDKKCTISATSYEKLGWTEKRVYTDIYTEVECNFEANDKIMTERDYASNVELPTYTVVLPIKYNEVRENQKIILYDLLWERWTYITWIPQANQSITWVIDCITLPVFAQKWQR